jgi:anti-sigma regulatory factor (Ser/Thr protein kinase)
VSAVLVLAITFGLSRMMAATDLRPYTIFYLAAVAAAAGGWGLRVGLMAGVAALVLADVWLLSPRFPTLNNRPRDAVELLGLFVGAATIALIAGRLHDALASLRDAVAARRDIEARQETFFRNLVAAVTHGRLQMVDRREIEALASDAPGEPVPRNLPITSEADVTAARRAVRAAARALDFGDERAGSLEVCVGEAATNALKHGGGGWMRLAQFADPAAVAGDDDAGGGREPTPGAGPGIRVLVGDNGGGMATLLLPYLALWRGYSTRQSLGMGFTIMLDLADRVLLSTGTEGTVVLIEMRAQPPAAAVDEIALAAFPSLV